MPNIDPFPCDGRVYKEERLRKTVEHLLQKRPASDAVIALTDVYTGTGDFIDAWQSRTISHFERAKIVFKTSSFFTIWGRFLAAAGYSRARYFISKEVFAIAEILINGLLALLIIYRDHLSTHKVPFLPWLHASEPNEHVFAAMRSVNPDFSVRRLS